MLLNPSLDKLSLSNSTDSPLSRWASLYSLKDVCWWRYPADRAYTCHSTSYRTMSRIDLIYVSGGGLLLWVCEVTILPRGISDHAPVLCCLQTRTPPSERLWQLSRYWISDDMIEIEISKCISEFSLTNDGSTSPKQYVGCLLKHISRDVTSHLSLEPTIVLQLPLRRLRPRHKILNPITYLDIQAAYQEVMLLRVAKTKKQQLAQTQRIFEQGEKNGRLLAWL